MTDAAYPAKASKPTPLIRAWSIALAWVFHGVANVLVLNLHLHPKDAAARFAHNRVDLGRHILAATVSALIVLGWSRLPRRYRRHPGWGLAAAAVVFGMPLLLEDARSTARSLAVSSGLDYNSVRVGVALAAAQVATVAWVVSRSLSTRRFGAVVLVPAAAAIYWFNAFRFAHQVPALHLLLSITAALVLAGAIAPLLTPGRRLARLTTLPTAINLGLSALGLVVGLVSVYWPLKHSTQLDMSTWSASLLVGTVGHGALVVPPPPELTDEEIAAGFFADRSERPPVAPTVREEAPSSPLVILISVDAMRADLINDAKYAKQLPNLHRLAKQGTRFANARSTSAGTVVALSSISTGKHFSQLYWTAYETDDWLPEDTSTHLAERLTAQGVDTWVAPGAEWFDQRFGMLRGFEHGEYKRIKAKFSTAKTLTKLIRAAMPSGPSAPRFIYAHFLDPHHPYTRGKNKDGTPFERYLSEVAVVDSKIGGLLRSLKKRDLLEHTTLIITADHGEAFGEHGVKHKHSVNLYDELVRVPLIVVGPDVAKQVVEAPVSIIDLGPTVLDLFGLPTPGDAMGQSLVPHLLGRGEPFHRPIAMEGLQKQAMVFANGIKVIRDLRRRTLEVYDLSDDPEELTNLSDDIDLEASAEYRRFHQFFEVHRFTADGYKHPRR